MTITQRHLTERNLRSWQESKRFQRKHSNCGRVRYLKMDGQQSCSQRISNIPLKKVEVQKLIECDVEEEEEEIHFIKQFVNEVLDFSSQYGSDTSISYTAYNLTGKPSKFPDYGDFPQAFVMKTYGNWWREAPSYLSEYVPQNTPKIASMDYVDVAFEQKVYPFTVSIYETYNPGSVVRIWAKNDSSNKKKWALLWEGEPVNVGHVPRIFSPIIKIINFKTNILRIEFNHSKLEYYTGIDAVLLVGTEEPVKTKIKGSNKFLNSNFDESNNTSSPIVLGKLTQQVMKLNLHNIPRSKTNLQAIVAEFHVQKPNTESSKRERDGIFQCLPNETILKILGYLDLSSLRRCAQLNRHFLSLCNDSFLYTKLSLRPYWSKLHDEALLSLGKKSQYLQQLDLSWCGSYKLISSTAFKRFLLTCCKNLTHIRLNCCKFISDSILGEIAYYCDQLKEIGLRNCTTINDEGFLHLSVLSTLEYLDLYRTNITVFSIIPILKANRDLLHLNIGSCIKITDMDEVAFALANYNKKLISVDFWKTSNLTQVGVAALSQCVYLEEVDFGWCLGFTLPVDSLAALATGCPRLKKLFLTALRGIADKDLEPFIRHCPNLEQIDLLGVRGITSDICLRLLMGLPKLRLLDLSFCDMISDSHISNWKRTFPNVSIKRSFQTEVSCSFLYQNFIE